MIFESVELENLFSYYGKQRFDFDGITSERNIVLIHGRNGYGKTSFLNSLKLLFLGPSEELRRAVQTSKMPSLKQYILGDGREWSGIFNRKARRERVTRASIRLSLRDEDSFYRLERSWELKDSNYDERLRIETPQGALMDEDVKDFLSQLIPPFVVPFFIFDGEQVQTLAEANRSVQLEQIERVLGLSPLDKQSEVLKQLIKSWEREGLAEEARRELNELERRRGKISDEIDCLEKKIQRLEEEKEELCQKLGELDRRIEKLRGYDEEQQELKRELEQRREQLEERLSEFTEPFARIAPLLVNRKLEEQQRLKRELVG